MVMSMKPFVRNCLTCKWEPDWAWNEWDDREGECRYSLPVPCPSALSMTTFITRGDQVFPLMGGDDECCEPTEDDYITDCPAWCAKTGEGY